MNEIELKLHVLERLCEMLPAEKDKFHKIYELEAELKMDGGCRFLTLMLAHAETCCSPDEPVIRQLHALLQEQYARNLRLDEISLPAQTPSLEEQIDKNKKLPAEEQIRRFGAFTYQILSRHYDAADRIEAPRVFEKILDEFEKLQPN